MAVKQSKIVPIDYCGRNRNIDVRTETYNSAAEVVKDGRNRPILISNYDVIRRGIRREWNGVCTYDEALDLLANGYQPVVTALSDSMKINSGENSRFTFNNDVVGFIPVIPLVLSGVPKCMVNIKMTPMKCKVIDIYYDMTANCSYEPEDFIRAGKIVLSTILGLEKQGYKFNLYGIQSYVGDSYTADLLCVKIKSSDRPLDLKRMSFPLTHPSFFRVIGFDWQSKSPIARNIGSGRGQSLSQRYDTRSAEKIIKTMYGNNAFYLSCTDLINHNYDKESLKEALTNAKVSA